MNNFELYKLKKAGLKNHHLINIINYLKDTKKSHLSLRDIAVVSNCKDPIKFIEKYKVLDTKLLRKEFNLFPSLSLLDKNYPPLLSEIYNPPVLLFYQGNLDLLNYPKLAVVGARKASEIGIKSVQDIIEQLNKVYVIVSGLARGIDTAAHLSALKNGGNTIAVIGSGFNHFYPKENKKLQQYIATNHLLLSEYGPDEAPLSCHFPERNRIIVGLAPGVLVADAKIRSGSLISCKIALEEGREVFAIPGNIVEPHSHGCNQLIKEGAKCVTSGLDIISELDFY
ncbi:DNA-processing protein DprA [Streptococcus didelphis]|uniref:DNA-processing protein DprA n=1 Tax=Streptococcus didelphis TaxID=102886 RepID=A0ABY9LJC4_9STRE|nr:DNA-processing protein DprA [Streptococcus didelphis]WMB28275.1 DNA-processing protein DprA [Streptococcus didelphis]WMB28948.1 DNA-processing protein DprA [Streptococcus didelphis]